MPNIRNVDTLDTHLGTCTFAEIVIAFSELYIAVFYQNKTPNHVLIRPLENITSPMVFHTYKVFHMHLKCEFVSRTKP